MSEPLHGRPITVPGDYFNSICPQCGAESTKQPPVTCPYCGTEMVDKPKPQVAAQSEVDKG